MNQLFSWCASKNLSIVTMIGFVPQRFQNLLSDAVPIDLQLRKLLSLSLLLRPYITGEWNGSRLSLRS